MSHNLILDFGFWILDLAKTKDQRPKTKNLFPPLNLVYLNFRIILTVTFCPFVMFAAFLYKNDNFFAASMSDDGCRNGCAAELGACAFARNQSLDVNLFAFFFINRRHAQGLTFLDRKLFSACSDNCVTHLFIVSLARALKSLFSRKVEIIPE